MGAAEARGDAQIDSIIFPGEATFSKVRTLPTPTQGAGEMAENKTYNTFCRLQVLVKAHVFTLWLLPQTKTEANSCGMQHLQYSCCQLHDPICSVLALYTVSCLCRMQEPKPDGDTQLTEQVNQVLTASIGMPAEMLCRPVGLCVGDSSLPLFCKLELSYRTGGVIHAASCWCCECFCAHCLHT